MREFSGYDYLLIDIANHAGYDKLKFEERISWTTQNLLHLEALADQADAKPLYVKAVMALRRAEKGEPIGHLVHFDAVCSGIQIMSAITGCYNGANATGLVDPDRRADAYTDVATAMNHILSQQGQSGVSFPRSAVKDAVMKSCYGSKKVPKDLFGEDTPELEAFYEAAHEVAPGAFTLLDELLNSWQPYALAHEWRLPDGFLSRVKVMQTHEAKVEVDELDHMTFMYEYKVNKGEKKGRANAANVVHSIDAYVLRSLVRRCSYDPNQIKYVHRLITAEILERAMGKPVTPLVVGETDLKLDYYIEQYERSRMIDTTILTHVHEDNVVELDTHHLKALNRLCEAMLKHPPFSVVTIHDSFACHPNNMNVVRYWYKELLAELADSEILSDILSQIHGTKGSYPKMIPNLSDYIRESQYALC